MRSAEPRGFVRRLLPFLLVVPLVVVPTVSALVAYGGGSNGVPVAAGSVGGAFHPVAGNFVPDGTDLSQCDGRYSCLEQAFGNISYARGPKRALAVFGAKLGQDADVKRDCHRIVHTIGSAAYARYDGNVARTFAEGSSICASGYYHGILERAFVGITSKTKLAAVARQLCLAVGIRRRSFLDYQCRHGLGHGFMIQTGYDLPTALSLCDALGTGWDRVTCTSGAFMENVSTRFGFRSAWLDEKRPLYPCTEVSVLYRRSCYVRATTWILQVEKNDFDKTAAICRSAGAEWVAACFRGFGRDAVVDASYRGLQRVRRLCALAGEYQSDCYYGAARTLGDGQGLAGVRHAAVLCAKAPVEARASCAAGLGIVVGLLYPTSSERRSACERLVPSTVDACSRAADDEVDPRGLGSWG